MLSRKAASFLYNNIQYNSIITDCIALNQCACMYLLINPQNLDINIIINIITSILKPYS